MYIKDTFSRVGGALLLVLGRDVVGWFPNGYPNGYQSDPKRTPEWLPKCFETSSQIDPKSLGKDSQVVSVVSVVF